VEGFFPAIRGKIRGPEKRPRGARAFEPYAAGLSRHPARPRMDVISDEQPDFPQYTEETSEAVEGRGSGHRVGGFPGITKSVNITTSVLHVKYLFFFCSQRLGGLPLSPNDSGTGSVIQLRPL
jgi:hypothetical protein